MGHNPVPQVKDFCTVVDHYKQLPVPMDQLNYTSYLVFLVLLIVIAYVCKQNHVAVSELLCGTPALPRSVLRLQCDVTRLLQD